MNNTFLFPSFSENSRDLLEQLKPSLEVYSQIFLICDTHTKEFCLPFFEDNLSHFVVIELNYGEAYKNLDSCNFVWQKLIDYHADRKSVILNLGGGVVGDLGGFAAACFKRGIDFIQIPTTLLAMVDACLGGKTGVDFFQHKNQIGVFQQPVGIYICQQFLQTLPHRELLAGFAEILKHYLIADAQELELFLVDTRPLALRINRSLIEKALLIKTSFVIQDPHDENVRKALNFGHTIGHGLESAMLHTQEELLHGEAVAAGIVAEAFISYRRNFLSWVELQRITQFVLEYFYFPPSIFDARSALLHFIRHDKKNIDREIRFVLLNGFGNYQLDVAIGEEDIQEAIDYLYEGIRNRSNA